MTRADAHDTTTSLACPNSGRLPARALVTGGFGFVGKALCDRLVRAGVDLLVVDNGLRGDLGHLPADIRGSVRANTADIRDRERLERIVADFQPELVVHLAAMHYIPDCERDPAECISINTAGTTALIEAVRASEHLQALVIASTAAVYRPSTEAHREEESLSPIDVYGFSKLWTEQIARLQRQSHGLPISVARLFNVVGPGETNPHLIPSLIAQALASDTIRVGDLSTRRDYIHVTDVAEGLLALASATSTDRVLTCNLGTGRAVDGWTVLAAIGSALGRELRAEQDASRMRISDRPVLLADPTYAASTIGWSSKVTFEAGMLGLVGASLELGRAA